MSSLAELQARFATAILREDAGPIATLIEADGLAPAARVRVYWNHVLASLTDALATAYPVVCRLVDRRFFDFAADRYIRAHPPAGPCLFEYGVTFPDFLARFPPCAGHPYLADIARLEWLMNVALHADEVPAMARTALGTVPETDVGRLVLGLDPSAAWLRSPWPVDRIWRANQDSADPETVIDLCAGPVCVEVRRQGEAVAFRPLESAECAFRAGLRQGLTLEAAAEAALAEDPGFDLGAAVRALLDEALVTGFRLDFVAVGEEDAR
jgi:hypothetical protein